MLEALLKRAPGVTWTRDALEGRRQAIAAAHARGTSGVETVTALTALADDTIRTALMEARWLAGDQSLFDEFTRTYREQVSGKRVQDYVAHKLVERQQEYGKYGSTNFLLEPNIKKSRGGLRDLHLLKWTGLARYETSSFEDLSAVGLLSAGDVAAVWDAQEVFWSVRHELHFIDFPAPGDLTFDDP